MIMSRDVMSCRVCQELSTTLGADSRCTRCQSLKQAGDNSPTIDFTVRETGDVNSDGLGASGFAERIVGRRIGSYDFETCLGRGGMAWVFLARHNTLERPCAIKVLCPERRERISDALDLFLAEARAAASLIHPHIVAIHNVGRLEEHSFIEMEYVPGRTLEQLVADQHPLPLADATSYLLQACTALAAAHKQGLVHRDFKPANILVRTDGTAKLADFGLAKRLATDPAPGADALAGTPQFMAPELFVGAAAGPLSDVYAVGVSYFYVLTGRFPFVSPTILGLAHDHTTQPIPDPRTFRNEIPAEAGSLITRCLAKNPQDRFPDGAAVLRELRRVLGEMRGLIQLVQTAVEGLNATAEYEDERVTLNVRVSAARTQRVYIEESRADPQRSRMVRVYSICAPINESYFRRALELNSTLPNGAVAVQDIDGAPHFVVLKGFWRSTCDPEEIRRSVQDVAEWADQIEHRLTGLDCL